MSMETESCLWNPVSQSYNRVWKLTDPKTGVNTVITRTITGDKRETTTRVDRSQDDNLVRTVENSPGQDDYSIVRHIKDRLDKEVVIDEEKEVAVRFIREGERIAFVEAYYDTEGALASFLIDVDSETDHGHSINWLLEDHENLTVKVASSDKNCEMGYKLETKKIKVGEVFSYGGYSYGVVRDAEDNVGISIGGPEGEPSIPDFRFKTKIDNGEILRLAGAASITSWQKVFELV